MFIQSGDRKECYSQLQTSECRGQGRYQRCRRVEWKEKKERGKEKGEVNQKSGLKYGAVL